ncbi:MAG: hypothetical protein AABZ44_03690, partial [Elusimicrobiota bacterium]
QLFGRLAPNAKTQPTTNGKVTFSDPDLKLRQRNEKDDATPSVSPNGWFITASTTASSGNSYAAGTSTAIPTSGGPADRFIIVMPGEQLEEGKISAPAGKVNSMKPQTLRAGTTYTMTVYAVDNSYNINTATQALVRVDFDASGWQYDDPYASVYSSTVWLSGGAASFDFNFKVGESTTTGGSKISRLVALSTTNALSSVESSTVTVMFAQEGPVKLQVLVPNEQVLPGRPPYDYGLTSGGKDPAFSYISQAAGESFNVTVRSVDRYWNVVATHTANVSLISEDPIDTPDPLSFIFTGSTTTDWTFQRAKTSGWKLWVKDQTAVLFTSTSPAIVVPAGSATRMQVLLAGEYWDENEPGGKGGLPDIWYAGVPNKVTINATDDFFNINTTENSIVLGQPNDPYAYNTITGANVLSRQLQSGTTVYDYVLLRATDTATGLGARFSFSDLDSPFLQNPNAQSVYFEVDPGPVSKLLMLMPGHRHDPGSVAGITGKISTQPAVTQFPVEVHATDNYWNYIDNDFSMARIQTTDPYDVHPATQQLIGGVTTFMVSMVSASTWTITVVDTATVNALVSYSTFVYIAPGTPAKLLAILPGEQIEQGSPSGKTGTPDFWGTGVQPSTAGVNFPVTLYVTDGGFNRVVSHPPVSIQFLTPTDPYDSESNAWGVGGQLNPQGINNGMLTYNMHLVRAATGQYIRVDENTANGYSASQTSTFTVVANEPSTLIVTLPGEQQTNGKNVSPAGISSTTTPSPLSQMAGVCLSTHAYAYIVDSYFNWVTGLSGSTVAVATNDSYDVDPGTFNIVNGRAVITNTSACPITARGDAKVTVAHTLYGSRDSSQYMVTPSQANRIHVLAEGESPTPGSSTGRSAAAPGDPGGQAAGIVFPVTIRITDSYWNQVTQGSTTVKLTTTDPNDIEPATFTVFGSVTVSSITLVRAVTTQVLIFDCGANGVCADGDDILRDNDGLDNNLVTTTDNLDDAQSKPITVSAGGANRIILIHHQNGQSLNQGATGYAVARAGSVSDYTAGVSFDVRVYLTDSYFNVRTGERNGHIVRVTAPLDSYADSPGFTGPIDSDEGYATISNIELRRAATQYLRAVYEPGTLIGNIDDNNTSATVFTVDAGNMTGIQILLPWETQNPGEGSYPSGGKIIGSTTTLYAGIAYGVRTRTVDQYFNTSINAGCDGTASQCPETTIITSDIFDAEISTVPFGQDGLRDFVITPKTRSLTHTLYAQDSDLTFGGNGNVNAANKTAPFVVESSSPVRLLVLLSGESEVEGKPADVNEYGISTPGAPAGKRGMPSAFIVGQSTQVTVHVVDTYYNRVRSGAQPEVKIYTPSDGIDDTETAVGVQTLSSGRRVFAFTPLRASLDYRIVAATTTNSSVNVASATSSSIVAYPQATHHIHFDLNAVQASTGTVGPMATWTPTVTAGDIIPARLTMHDIYHNVTSSGPYLYRGTVTVSADSSFSSNQNPEFPCCGTPPDITFTNADAGSKYVSNIVRLKKKGVQYVQATDKSYDNIHANVTGFSDWPQITVDPGEPVAVTVTVDDSAVGSTVIPAASAGHTADTEDTEVGAGNTSSVPGSLGRAKVIGQMSDQFDNAATIPGVTVYVQLVDISSTPTSGGGDLRLESAGSYESVGISTMVLSDAQGKVGVAAPIWYFAFQKLDDSARVWMGTMTAPSVLQYYKDNYQNITSSLTTIGGNAYELTFITVPPGNAVLADQAGAYTVARRDAFGNLTTNGSLSVNLNIPASEQTVHTNAGFSLATSGDPAGNAYGFRKDDNSAYINSVIIPNFQSAKNFIYRDKMASTPAGEDGRTGVWTIRTQQAGVTSTPHSLTVNPGTITQLAFDNVKRTLRAGSFRDPLTDEPRELILQTRDTFGNPSASTATVIVDLAVDRNASKNLDGFSLSLSSTMVSESYPPSAPPAFVTPLSTLTFSVGNSGKTFYYLDTNASFNYGASSMTYPQIIATARQVSWNNVAQSVLIDPAVINKIGIVGQVQTLLAGVTSQAFTVATEDVFANAAINPGPGNVSLSAFTNSTGTIIFSGPWRGGNPRAGPGSIVTPVEDIATIVPGAKTTDFFMMDTMVGISTLAVTYLGSGWQVGVQTYTVTPGPPDHLVFATPARRLIAGTTTSYEVTGDNGTPADPADDSRLLLPAHIGIELRDKYENVTTGTDTISIELYSVDSTAMRAGLFSDKALVDGADWRKVGVGQSKLPVPISSGSSSMTFYI